MMASVGTNGPSSEDLFDRITSLLTSAQVEFTVLEHPPVTTSADAARVRGVPLHTGAKAMLIKSPKGFHLAVLPADHLVDWKKFRAVLGARDLRFANDEETQKLTGLAKGAIPPFGNLLNLDTWFDQALLAIPIVRFNAGRHDRSIEMRSSDLRRVVSPGVAEFSQPKDA